MAKIKCNFCEAETYSWKFDTDGWKCFPLKEQEIIHCCPNCTEAGDTIYNFTHSTLSKK